MKTTTKQSLIKSWHGQLQRLLAAGNDLETAIYSLAEWLQAVKWRDGLEGEINELWESYLLTLLSNVESEVMA